MKLCHYLHHTKTISKLLKKQIQKVTLRNNLHGKVKFIGDMFEKGKNKKKPFMELN